MPANPYVQAAIQAIHAAQEHEQDPEAIQVLATCQKALTSLQAKQLAPGQGPRGAVLQQLGAQ